MKFLLVNNIVNVHHVRNAIPILAHSSTINSNFNLNSQKRTRAQECKKR